MKQPILVLTLAAVLATAGCSSVRESRLNPFNWFGRSTAERAPEDVVNPLIPKRRESIFRQEQDSSYRGDLVAEVTELSVDRRPGGAIIRAEGRTDTLGFYDVRLVLRDDADNRDSLTYELKALQVPAPQGSGSARVVSAAQWITDSDLDGIREIRVVARGNSRVSRR